MTTFVTGARGTTDITQGLRKVDMASKISLLDPSANPFTLFTKKASSKSTYNTSFQWAEDTLEPRFDAVNAGGGYTSSATQIVVDNANYFAEHDIVLNTASNEVIRVQSVNTGTQTLDIVRGVGSTAASMTDNDELMIIGSAQPEGDTAKPARSINASLVTNYCQIFRQPVEETETNRHSDLFVDEDDEAYTEMKAGIEHAIEQESACLFGGGAIDTTGPKPRRTTKGLTRFIVTNTNSVGGAMSEATFFGGLRPAFRYGSKKKLGLAAGLPLDVLNGYARGKIQVTDQGRSAYGVDVVDYISPHGTLTVARHDLLEGTKWGKAIIVVDLAETKWRFLANRNGSRDTALYRDRQAPSADTRMSEYITEGGIQVGLEQCHAIYTGITS